MRIGGRRAGKRAQLEREREEYVKAAGRPVLGADVLACGCALLVLCSYNDETGVITIEDTDSYPCDTHKTGEAS